MGKFSVENQFIDGNEAHLEMIDKNTLLSLGQETVILAFI